jgi:hypothetical protein
MTHDHTPKKSPIKNDYKIFVTPEEKRKANAKYQRKYRKRNLRDARKAQVNKSEELKLIVFNHYSNKNIRCACCEEDEYKFLTLDHTNNDGSEDRKNNPSHATGIGLYRRLIKNNFPEGIQILCWNCNMSKAFHGVCPHKE